MWQYDLNYLCFILIAFPPFLLNEVARFLYSITALKVFISKYNTKFTGI